MKFSQFNTLLPIDENHSLLYNAFSDKYIVLKPTTYEAVRVGSVEQIKNEQPLLYEQLVDCKALVDENIEEWREVFDHIHEIIEDDSDYELQVNPTVDCNFRCWYCYENHVKGSRMDVCMVEKVKRHIDKVLSTHHHLQRLHISFFGGEPLMYFSTVAGPLIAYAKKACADKGVRFMLHFTTNGYLLNRKMIEAFEGIPASFQITLDGAREQHNRTRFMPNGKGSFDRIVQNIKSLTDFGHVVILRINYTAVNMYDISSICSSLADVSEQQKQLIRVNFQRVWQDSDSKFHDDEVRACISKQMAAFKDAGFRVSYHKIMSARPCYGDMRNHVLINYNGDAFCCTARDFDTHARAGYLADDGTIVWENEEKERRMSLKFSREECHRCRIAPICGGGCTQRAVERMSIPGCSLDFTDEDINQMLLERFEYVFMSSENDVKSTLCKD